MNEIKYYNISDLIKISGLSGNEIRYLVRKYKIEHKIMRTRKYFDRGNLEKILLLANDIYLNVKKPKNIFDKTSQIDSLIKKFSQIKLQIEKIILD
jgi:hypothetical protein